MEKDYQKNYITAKFLDEIIDCYPEEIFLDK